MSEPSDALAELWMRTSAPARDLEFELAVEERISRRQILVDGALSAGAVGLAGLALIAGWPGISIVAQSLTTAVAGATPALAISGAMVLLALWLSNAGYEPER